MIKININKCFGCQACLDCCPTNAVSFKKMHYGYQYPVINKEKCINCNLCNEICMMHDDIFPTKRHRFNFTFSHSNSMILNNSSSGGFSMALAEIFLQKKYIVYGVGYSEQLNAISTRIENERDLYKIQKSKYMKADLTNTYKNILADIENDKKVLFFGLPCEVYALNKFVGLSKSKNLVTVALLCGGNLSPVYFQHYKKYLEKKYKRKVIDINFRSKKHGPSILVTEIVLNNNKSIEIPPKDNFYVTVLGSDYVRPNCLSCPFELDAIDANFIIGDLFNQDRGKGVSLVSSTENSFLEIKNELTKKGVISVCEDIEKYIGRRNYKKAPTDEYIKKFYNSILSHSFKHATFKYVINKFSFTRKIYYFLPNSFKRLYVKWKTR